MWIKSCQNIADAHCAAKAWVHLRVFDYIDGGPTTKDTSLTPCGLAENSTLDGSP